MLLQLFAFLLVVGVCYGVERFPNAERHLVTSSNTVFNFSYGYYVYESFFDSNCVDSSLYVAQGLQLGVCSTSGASSTMYVSGWDAGSGTNQVSIYELYYNTLNCTGAYTAYFLTGADGSCAAYAYGGGYKFRISDRNDDFVNYPYAGGVRFLYENGGDDDVACDTGKDYYYWVYNLCNYCDEYALYCECNSESTSYYEFISSTCTADSIVGAVSVSNNECIGVSDYGDDDDDDDDEGYFDNSNALSSNQCTSMYGKPYFGPFLPLVPSPYPTNMPFST